MRHTRQLLFHGSRFCPSTRIRRSTYPSVCASFRPLVCLSVHRSACPSICLSVCLQILEELVTLRRYHAQLLGFPSHAAYVLEERMAASVDTVTSFLGELGRDLKPLHQADLASLTALKRGEQGAAAGPLSMADYR